MKPLGISLVIAGAALLAFDVYMSLAWAGFLVPQMVLALAALGLMLGGFLMHRKTSKPQS